MKAAVYDRYGPADMVRVEEIEQPRPGRGEVLVKVHASAVSTADWRIRASAFPAYAWLPGRAMFGLFKPRNRVLGTDFAGTVTALGDAVSGYDIGDALFGFCGKGGHAEYLAVSADGAIAKKPGKLGFDEAAAVPFGALAALVFLRDFARVQPGQQVLINGASGGVGVFAVQLAKHFGAQVTGICSAGNAKLVRALGAKDVIDYRKQDFAQTGRQWDVILDTVGKTSFSHCRSALTPQGRYVPLEFGFREIVQALATSMGNGQKVLVGVSGDSKEDMEFVAELLKKGKLKPVIDKRYPLRKIADAHRRVESRHKTGSVIVTLGSG